MLLLKEGDTPNQRRHLWPHRAGWQIGLGAREFGPYKLFRTSSPRETLQLFHAFCLAFQGFKMVAEYRKHLVRTNNQNSVKVLPGWQHLAVTFDRPVCRRFRQSRRTWTGFTIHYTSTPSLICFWVAWWNRSGLKLLSSSSMCSSEHSCHEKSRLGTDIPSILRHSRQWSQYKISRDDNKGGPASNSENFALSSKLSSILLTVTRRLGRRADP